jgi:alpha-L-fucosidase
VAFTHAQIRELTSDYGRIDILWLDGGWVRPRKDPGEIESDEIVPWPQDIDMPGLSKMARRNQPGLIVVDRAVGGAYENYRTPEQKIPDEPLLYPWETCMTLGDSWSYTPNDNYKPARDVVHMLVDVVAKGGNYLLNVGPDPNGELPPEALSRMREIGDWMDVNGEAIYKSRAIAPYRDGKWRFTTLRDGSVYAIYLAGEDEKDLPATLRLTGVTPAQGVELHLLGSDAPLRWKSEGTATVIEIPADARQQLTGTYAWTVRIPRIDRHADAANAQR